MALCYSKLDSRAVMSHFDFVFFPLMNLGFPGGSDTQESACSTGDPGSISGSGRSPGERSDELNGNLASVNSQG